MGIFAIACTIMAKLLIFCNKNGYFCDSLYFSINKIQTIAKIHKNRLNFGYFLQFITDYRENSHFFFENLQVDVQGDAFSVLHHTCLLCGLVGLRDEWGWLLPGGVE